jgi:choline dehydrogenase-like flavoprotein
MDSVGGRQVKVSRGRFLGGSSGVNGTLCIRGTKQDYDDWGMEEWTGDKMFRYMAKVSDFSPHVACLLNNVGGDDAPERLACQSTGPQDLFTSSPTTSPQFRSASRRV